MAVTVLATTYGSTNVVEDSNGTLWLIAFKTGDLSTPYAYYSQNDGAAWTESGALTDYAGTAQYSATPSRLIVTDQDEFIFVDGLRVHVYELATATTWTFIASANNNATNQPFTQQDVCAYAADSDNVWIHIAFPTTGGTFAMAPRVYNRTAGTITAVGSNFTLGGNHPRSAGIVHPTGNGEWAAARPAKLFTVSTMRHVSGSNAFSLYRTAAWDGSEWVWGGAQQAVPVSVSPGINSDRYVHLTYNPQRGTILWVSGVNRGASGAVSSAVLTVSEYTFTTDMWADLGWALPDDGVEAYPRRLAAGGYDNDGGVHVVYYRESGSTRRITHDTWDRSTQTWSTETIATPAADVEAVNANHDSASSKAVRWTYVTGGNLLFDQIKFNRPPDVPVLVQPAALEHRNLTLATTFSAVYTDPDGDPLDAYALRHKVGAAAYEYWDGNSFEASETWLTPGATVESGGTIAVTIPGGTKANGTTNAWSFRVRDPDGDTSAYATDETYVAAVPPSVTVTAPVSPVTGTNTRPTTSITYSGSNAKASHRILYIEEAVYTTAGFTPDTVDADDVLWASGTVASSGTGPVTPAADVIDGRTYRVYWQVVDSIGAASPWAFAEFDVDLTPPAAATLAGTVDPDNSRMLLVATAVHDEGDYPDADAVFQRLTDAGWVDVLGGTEVPFVDGEAQIYDEESTPGATESWRVTVRWDNGAGSVLESDPSNILEATVDATGDWLKNLFDPDDSMRVHILDLSTTDPGADTVHQPINRPDAVIVSDATRLEQGSITFRTDSLAERDDLRALLDRRYPLLLQMKADDDGAGDTFWLQFHGDRSRERITIVPEGTNRVSQSWVRQLRPEALAEEGS